MTIKGIEVIYWDLGKVCINDNLRPLFKEFGVEFGPQQEYAWGQYKLGRIKSKEFFRDATIGKILKIPEMEERARELITPRDDGAPYILADLKRQENVRQGILSNHSWEWGRYALNEVGLKHFVEPGLVVISAEVGYAKPDPMIFRIAQERAGVDYKKILFFDDKLANVVAAKHLGMHAEEFRDLRDAVLKLERYGFSVK